MKEAYIVKAYRTAVGKAPKGLFRFKRPDELASETINHMMGEIPELDKTRIDDVIVGNATPEAEQGLNIGRVISLMGLKVEDVPGVTVNRYCASGLETIAMASAKIKSGFFSYKPIEITTIKKVRASNSILSSPAASLDRIAVSYGQFDQVLLSPIDKIEFVEHLQKINPNIENEL